MTKRRLGGLLLAGICGLGILVVAPAPAYAYLARVSYGANYASVAEDRINVEVCDREADGNGVYGIFENARWETFTVHDPDGSGGGCGNGTFPNVGPIVRFKICEKHTLGDDCSGYRDVPSPVFLTHVLIRNSATDRCVDLPGTGAGYAGGPVNQWGCARNDNQEFTFVSAGDGLWSIRNDRDGLCLDLPGTGWVPPATQVGEYYCAARDNQFWATGSTPRFVGYVEGIPRDFYWLQNFYWNGSYYQASGLCLELPGNRTAQDGARLQVYNCAGGDDHEWTWY